MPWSAACPVSVQATIIAASPSTSTGSVAFVGTPRSSARYEGAHEKTV